MESISEILNKAKLRAEQMKLPYAGALLPIEAYELMRNEAGEFPCELSGPCGHLALEGEIGDLYQIGDSGPTVR